MPEGEEVLLNLVFVGEIREVKAVAPQEFDTFLGPIPSFLHNAPYLCVQTLGNLEHALGFRQVFHLL